MQPVLFDLDGTLVESGPSIIASIKYALKQVDGPELDAEALRSFIGPPLQVSFRDIAGLHGSKLEDVVQIYIGHQLELGIKAIELYDGIFDLVGALAGAGVPMAIATSKRTQNAKMVLQHVGLIEKFHIVSGAEPGRMEKRHSIETAREALVGAGLDLDNAVMIGDRIHDIDGAAHFNMPSIAVTWGYGTEDEWQRADHIARSVGELREMLLG